MFDIRPYHPTDFTDLYRICLLTGDNGNDATPIYRDPDLQAHFYAGPYAYLEPELCFILTKADRPVGYVLGTQDSATFARRCEEEWFPPLRKRYAHAEPVGEPYRDHELIKLINGGHHSYIPGPTYPAHLHIDILPDGQGGGYGRKLIERFCAALRERGVPGVFLGVGKGNQNAIGFYKHVGFQVLEDHPWGYHLGIGV